MSGAPPIWLASLNPFHSIEHHIARPLLIHGRTKGQRQTHERVLGMLERVNLSPAETFASRRPHELSGGQRQRIALARAILRDPQILILDEATSQIDLESEQLIHQALEEFSRGRTVLIITHRLATLRLADRILVMNGGRVADFGTHSELMERCEFYERLCSLQFRQTA